ncbi:DgyrCDS1158 [Dimorphilus gyrociliatus]|uniref:DgyrCDS1158 n=1 Tax=Dimorphilus gyrociliatus TaxID=2664684 RepID=A0A7I8V6F9_9ANNE|nr:DgyrCDS1158 [Dimorphilus gyrociliatus]
MACHLQFHEQKQQVDWYHLFMKNSTPNSEQGNSATTSGSKSILKDLLESNEDKQRPHRPKSAWTQKYARESGETVKRGKKRRMSENDGEEVNDEEDIGKTVATQCGNSSTLKCQYCGITFEDAVMHSLHMGCHSHSNPYMCNVCGLLCSSKFDFYSHMMRGEHEREPTSPTF